MSRRRSLFDEEDESAALLPKRALSGDLDITPLIDVVFLLLIFFMVTSTMKGTPDVDVPFAHYGVGVPSRVATVVTLRLTSELEPPVIVLGDGRGREGDLAAVREHVEQGLREGHNTVIIKAERHVPHGFVQEVAKAVGAVEGIRFNIGVQEKR